jgi:hypothetical protein
MSEKICPLMSRPIYWYPGGSIEDQGPELYEVDCKMTRCELWTSAYIEPIEHGAYKTEGCAFKIQAMQGKVKI